MNHKKTNPMLLLLFFIGINVCRNFLWLIPSALMDPIMQDMHFDYNQSGQLVLVVTVIMGIMLMCSGYILKVVHPCSAILIGMVCLSIDGFCSFWGTGFPVLILGKVFCGIGYGLTTFSCTALIAACFPQERIGLANGLNTCINSLSIAIAYQFIVPASDFLGSWRSEALWWGIFSLVVAVLFYLWTVFQKDPILSRNQSEKGAYMKEALGYPEVKYFGVMIGCMMLPYVCTTSYYPTYLFQVQDFLLTEANSIASVISIAGMLGSLFMGVIFPRVCRLRYFPAGTLLFLIAGFIGMTTLQSPVLILISVSIFGFCYFGLTAFCASFIMCLPEISPLTASSAISLMNGCGSLLALVVPVIQKTLTDQLGMQYALMCFGLLYIPAFLASLQHGSKEKR